MARCVTMDSGPIIDPFVDDNKEYTFQDAFDMLYGRNYRVKLVHLCCRSRESRMNSVFGNTWSRI